MNCALCSYRANRAEERNHTHPDFTTCGYPGQDWFPLSLIRLCPPQVLWCMAWMELLEDGEYPTRSTGYTDIDPAVRYVRRLTDMFTKVADLHAELTDRLDRVPDRERQAFELETRPDIDVEALNKDKELRLKLVTVEGLGEDSYNVLRYVSGGRKTMDFRVWLAITTYRENQRKRISNSIQSSI